MRCSHCGKEMLQQVAFNPIPNVNACNPVSTTFVNTSDPTVSIPFPAVQLASVCSGAIIPTIVQLQGGK